MSYGEDKTVRNYLLVGGGIVVVLLVIGLFMWLLPLYSVWQQGLSGQAKLREAEYSKQVEIEEAKAKLESAKYLNQAEVERARGVAEANEIIGKSLEGNDEYLRYLWIQGLQDGSSEVIYIPTEAGLPILEAGKRVIPKPQPAPAPQE